MSSKQTNFFIVPEDLDAIKIFFKKKGILTFKDPFSSNNKNLMATEADITEKKYYKVFLTKEEFKSKTFFRQVNDETWIDSDKSYVIEFDLGRIDINSNSTQILHRARFYTVTGFYGSADEKVRKDVDFIKWVETVYKLFKKQFLKKTEIDKDYPFSEAALNWVKKNNGKMDTAGLKITGFL